MTAVISCHGVSIFVDFSYLGPTDKLYKNNKFLSGMVAELAAVSPKMLNDN